MDKGTQSLINVFMSVLAPVLILDYCSKQGDSFWHLGTMPAMAIALALPLGYGIYLFSKTRKLDMVNGMGLIGTLLTAFVTVYANTGDGGAIRPDTPWWYAIKEATIPLLLAACIILTAKGSGSLLRVFVYTDGIFDISRIEKKIEEKNLTQDYQRILWRASLLTASALIFSSVANFFLSLYFLLPVTGAPEAEQSLLYNYAVSDMTKWGYVVISVPILVALIGVMFYLVRQLRELTGLEREDVFLH